MSHHFTRQRPTIGAPLPAEIFGRLVADFRFSSHVPMRGGHNTGRHIYLALSVPTGPQAGVFECAVNIRSDENTEVLYTQRTEDVNELPEFGFDRTATLAYGKAPSSDTPSLGLADADFAAIQYDDLYNQISDLARSCERIAVYGVTYDSGDGIHDVHMNSGTDPGDEHSADDRMDGDGAIVFYFTMQSGGQQRSFAQWILIKFATQSLVRS